MSKKFQNSYASSCHFALVLQLEKKDNRHALTNFFLVRTIGFEDSLDPAVEIYRQLAYFRGVPVFEPQGIPDFSCISWCKWRHNCR